MQSNTIDIFFCIKHQLQLLFVLVCFIPKTWSDTKHFSVTFWKKMKKKCSYCGNMNIPLWWQILKYHTWAHSWLTSNETWQHAIIKPQSYTCSCINKALNRLMTHYCNEGISDLVFHNCCKHRARHSSNAITSNTVMQMKYWCFVLWWHLQYGVMKYLNVAGGGTVYISDVCVWEEWNKA